MCTHTCMNVCAHACMCVCLSVPPPLAALTPSAPVGTALYSRLREYLLTQEQLRENGYPFPHPERPGGAVIFTAEEKKPKDREYPPSTALGRRTGWLALCCHDRRFFMLGGYWVASPSPTWPLCLSICLPVCLFSHSLLQNLLSLWHRVPCVLLRPLCAQRGVLLPLGAAAAESR